MNLNTDILTGLNEIFDNRENSYDIMWAFENFKQGNTIILVDVKKDKQFCLTDYDVVKNSADKIPSELLKRLIKTVQDYIDEQDKKLKQVQISNLPWDERDN